MSIDYTVVCSRPLPPDWSPTFSIEERCPFDFDFWISDFAEWKAETDAWIEECLASEASPFVFALRERLEQPWSFVAHFSGGEVTHRCMAELTEACGGFYWDDHTAILSAIAPGRDHAKGAEILRAWKRVFKEHAADEKQRAKEKRREWGQAAAADPEAYAEANDWSDV